MKNELIPCHIADSSGPTRWTPLAFGTLADRFGITWIVQIAVGPAGV